MNKWNENSLTRSTSVVMSVMICALLEKSSSSLFSSFDLLSASAAAPFVAALASGPEPEDDAMSFRTSVFAYRMELSCTLKLTCRVVVERDHSWPVTARTRGQHNTDGAREGGGSDLLSCVSALEKKRPQQYTQPQPRCSRCGSSSR